MPLDHLDHLEYLEYLEYLESLAPLKSLLENNLPIWINCCNFAAVFVIRILYSKLENP